DELSAVAVAGVGIKGPVVAVAAPGDAVAADLGARVGPLHKRLLRAGDLAVLDVELAGVAPGLLSDHIDELLLCVVRGRGHRRRGGRGGDRAAGAGADGERRVADADVDDGEGHAEARSREDAHRGALAGADVLRAGAGLDGAVAVDDDLALGAG